MSNAQKSVTPEMQEQIVEVKLQLQAVVHSLKEAQRAVECLLRNELHDAWQEILGARSEEHDEFED